ncbi:MAG: Grx4 family monothiol glutaredoxin [Myxococcales bacterium]|nr:Grx4 family monothiol glutaredoxin [Myxococcales bacterium]
MSEVHQKIAGLVAAHPVVLFMKGSRRFPQCGFSGRVVSILDQVLPGYETVNVLSDPALRDGIKAFSEWPTIPQLYVKGKFVGGADIVTEMFESGELKELLGDLAAPAAPAKAPSVTLTEAAAKAFADAKESADDVVRLTVDAQFKVDLFFDAKQPDDFVVAAAGITLVVDAATARRADGIRIDFVAGENGGFRIDNPNEPPRVRPLGVVELKAMLERGEKLALFDVRTPPERAIVKIAGDVFLDEAGLAHLEGLSRDTPVVFYCHHGGRSRSAAERFLSMGFVRVYNVEGGVDAWARTVDPSLATY